MFETEKKTEQNRERDDQMSEPKPLFIYHNVRLKGEKKKNTTVESICYAGFFTEIRQCPPGAKQPQSKCAFMSQR